MQAHSPIKRSCISKSQKRPALATATIAAQSCLHHVPPLVCTVYHLYCIRSARGRHAVCTRPFLFIFLFFVALDCTLCTLGVLSAYSLHSRCTLDVLSMYSRCALSVLYLYSICTLFVHTLYRTTPSFPLSTRTSLQLLLRQLRFKVKVKVCVSVTRTEVIAHAQLQIALAASSS